MLNMRSFLKPDGVAILAVPVRVCIRCCRTRVTSRAQVGVDAVVWNLHRIYGAARLPLLLRGWSVIAAAGFEDVVMQSGYYNSQPVMLLAASEVDQGFSWNLPAATCNEQLRQLRLCAFEDEQ